MGTESRRFSFPTATAGWLGAGDAESIGTVAKTFVSGTVSILILLLMYF